MKLLIDTSDKEKVEVGLQKNNLPLASITEHNKYGSQVLLPAIKKLLGDNNLSLPDISSIEVATGPGSFTGLKVGASVANALGFALGVSVNGKEMEVELRYI